LEKNRRQGAKLLSIYRERKKKRRNCKGGRPLLSYGKQRGLRRNIVL